MHKISVGLYELASLPHPTVRDCSCSFSLVFSFYINSSIMLLWPSILCETVEWSFTPNLKVDIDFTIARWCIIVWKSYNNYCYYLFVADVVQKDLKSTLRILYSLFQKFKSVKWLVSPTSKSERGGGGFGSFGTGQHREWLVTCIVRMAEIILVNFLPCKRIPLREWKLKNDVLLFFLCCGQLPKPLWLTMYLQNTWQLLN